MLEEDRLQLLWSEPLALHLDGVVGASPVGHESVRVDRDQIAAHEPLSPEGQRRLSRVADIAETERVPPHPQPAHLAGGDLGPVLVTDLDLEPGDDPAQSARV